jgi:hypothetical protein
LEKLTLDSSFLFYQPVADFGVTKVSAVARFKNLIDSFKPPVEQAACSAGSNTSGRAIEITEETNHLPCVPRAAIFFDQHYRTKSARGRVPGIANASRTNYIHAEVIAVLMQGCKKRCASTGARKRIVSLRREQHERLGRKNWRRRQSPIGIDQFKIDAKFAERLSMHSARGEERIEVTKQFVAEFSKQRDAWKAQAEQRAN